MLLMQRENSCGEYLRRLRLRMGLTTREVAQMSRLVAVEEKSDAFTISHSWLVKIENEESVPSIHKLFSLSAIYGTSLPNIISAYLDLGATSRLHFLMPISNTHLSQFECASKEKKVSFPACMSEAAGLDKTNLLSRMVEVWGEIPISMLEHLNLRKFRYGFVGLSDYRMYPLIRPGSFVQIDDCQRVPKPVQYRTEHDRPIYFIELRSGYLCSWCEIRDGRLISIPHPLSPCHTEEFSFPSEAEIVGRVVGAAVRLVASTTPQLAKKNAGGSYSQELDPTQNRAELPLAVPSSRPSP